MITKEDELIDKQMEIFIDAFNKTIQEETEKCVKKDGKVYSQAISMALGNALGASLGALTSKLSDSEAEDIYELVCNVVKECANTCRKDLSNNGKEN
jgi:hypothetical protein